jgi:hypothetical protein
MKKRLAYFFHDCKLSVHPSGFLSGCVAGMPLVWLAIFLSARLACCPAGRIAGVLARRQAAPLVCQLDGMAAGWPSTERFWKAGDGMLSGCLVVLLAGCNDGWPDGRQSSRATCNPAVKLASK